MCIRAYTVEPLNACTVEPLNATLLGPAKSVLIREVSSFQGELIHDPIALGLYKGVLNMEVLHFRKSTFRGSTVCKESTPVR